MDGVGIFFLVAHVFRNCLSWRRGVGAPLNESGFCSILTRITRGSIIASLYIRSSWLL